MEKKIQANTEQLKVQVSSATAFGINIDASFIIWVVLANLHAASQHEWGRDLLESHQIAHKKYPYLAIHTASILQAILTELNPANNAHDPSNAPAP